MIEYKKEIKTARKGDFNFPAVYDMSYPVNTKDNLLINTYDNALKPMNNFNAPTIINVKNYHVSFDFSSYNANSQASGGVFSGFLSWVLMMFGIYVMYQIGFGSVDVIEAFGATPLGGLMEWL